MKIGVIGCGRWGSFIAWYLDSIGHEVTLYGRAGSARMQRFEATRTNDLLTLPESMCLTTSLHAVLQSEAIVISIGAQGLSALLEEIGQATGTQQHTFILCMKGIRVDTCERLSQIVAARFPQSSVAVWLGPGHVQEFVSGIPNCMVIDSQDDALKHKLVEEFSSDLIRFYYGEDLLGNEIGAAAKNVIGIAAGVLDGLGLSTLKGALTSRGAREISRLITAMGGNPLCAYGLCHLGDYGATVFSKYSHNRRFGEAFAKGEPYDKLAEGATTVCAFVRLGEQYGVELPICHAVYNTLYKTVNPKDAIGALFARSIKYEF